MKVFLDLSGWFKEMDIPRYSLSNGRIEATLYPPMNALVADRDKSPVDNSVNVMFTFLGKRKNGIPVFQYEN